MQQAAVLEQPVRTDTHISSDSFRRLRIAEATQLEDLFIPKAQCAQLMLRPFRAEATVLQSGPVRIVVHSTRDSLQLHRTQKRGRISIGFTNRAQNVMHRGRPLSSRDIVVLQNGEAELNFVGPAEFVWIDTDASRLPALSERDVLFTSREPALSTLRAYVANLLLFHLNGLPHEQLIQRESELLDLVKRVVDYARLKPGSSKRERAFALVQRVERFMWDNVEDPLTLRRICEAAGCRSRSLTYYFKALVGVGPMTYLKIRRLENAHRRLREADGPVRIFDVAADFGFWHMGHFSADYKRMFGTTASETRTLRKPDST